jgi:hypothetical protein
MQAMSRFARKEIWGQFYETYSDKIYTEKPNLVKFKFVIMTLYGCQMP